MLTFRSLTLPIACVSAFLLSQAITTPGLNASQAPSIRIMERSEPEGTGAGNSPSARFVSNLPNSVYLPLVNSAVGTSACPSIPSETYTTLTVNPPPTDRPADQHADLNLSLRGYIATTGFLGLVDLGGATDLLAPQLPGLFVDNRTGVFTGLSQVYDWNWATNSRGAPISDPPVSLATLKATTGENILVPSSGYNIGDARAIPPPGRVFLNSVTGATGYQVLVLYAASDRITLKYTRDDNVIYGYTLHVEQICVEPRLLDLYNQMNTAGRSSLPALKAEQAFGTAVNQGVGVVIRDTGSFMDPRSRKDWWQGR